MSWMRRRPIWLILIASLALNAGVGATVGVRAYRNYRGPYECGRGPGRGSLVDELDLTPEQAAQVEADRLEMFEGIDEVQQQLRQTHETLAELMAAPEPDREAISEQISRTSALHEQKHRRLIEHFLGIKQLLDADQQKTFNETIRRTFGRYGCDKRGFGGPHGPRNGPGRGWRGPSHGSDNHSHGHKHEETER